MQNQQENENMIKKTCASAIAEGEREGKKVKF